MVIDADDRVIHCRASPRCRSGGGDPRVATRPKRPQHSLDHLRYIQARQVASDHDGRPARIQHGCVDASEHIRRQPRNRLLVTRGRSGIRRVGRVDRRDEGLIDTPARVRLDLQQIVEPFVAESSHVRLRERRPLRQFRKQLQRRAKAARSHIDRRCEGIPAGVDVERRPKTLGSLDQLYSRVALRSLCHSARSENRRSGHIGRFVACSSPDDQVRRDKWSAGQIHRQNLQTRRQGSVRSKGGKS